MCFLFRSASPPAAFEVEQREKLPGEQLLFPMYEVPLIRGDQDKLVAETRQWGWLPANWKPYAKYKTRKKYQRERVNARCETIHSTWGFKKEFAAGQRCILLSDAFHEPFEGSKGNWFAAAGMIGIAGLWAQYEGEEAVSSCTMLTTEANDFVREHRTGRMRMPIVLNEKTARMWLDPDRVEPQHFEEVFTPVDAGVMELIRESKS